jgi:4-hydroxy-3-methylbut-2-enyl diphosphate reductase
LAVTGVAGALVTGLRPGTIVVGDRVLRDPLISDRALSDQVSGDPMIGYRATGDAILSRRVLGAPDGLDGSVPGRFSSAPLLAAALRRRGLPVLVGPVVSSDHLVRGVSERARLARTGALAVDMESADLVSAGWDCPTAVVRVIADTPDRELWSLATLSGGRRALTGLRDAGAVLELWGASVGPRTVLLAGPRSFCAGVDRAIQTVERALERFGAPVYVRRQIVHNRHVVEDLEARGAVFVQELDDVPPAATAVFSAHGVAPAVRSRAQARGLRVIDATCPLVAKVHREVHRFRERGYQVVLIGHDGHDETEGTLGEADDIVLIENLADVDALHVDNPARLAYITQTTLSQDDVAGLVNALTERFPAIVGPPKSDVCYATQNRQSAVRAIASECDLLLVVGSRNSSNTARLAEVAEREGCRAELLDDESELQLEWLAGTSTVGVTAGASAPEAMVQRVVQALSWLGPLEVQERLTTTETVAFPLPMEVR